MWKFGVLVFPILLATSHGQEQYLREVTNPTGPSQIVIRGGFLGNSQIPDRVELVPQQPEIQQNTLSDPPQQVGLPLQASLDAQPIPQDGGADNPFTNGESGFGLRLSQASPQAQQQQYAPQFVQQQPQNAPHFVQQQPQNAPQFVQQHLQNSLQFVQQQQQQYAPQFVQQQQRQGVPQFFHQQVVPQQQIIQPGPILQQQPLTLPQLPAGQQYVDVFGRPIVFSQPQGQVAQPQAQAQAAQPQPTAPPTNPPPPPPPVEKQALVDQYGRQLAEIHVQQAPQVIQTHNAPVQVAQTHVIQQLAQPIAQQQVLQHVIQPAPLLQKVGPAPLTLKTYAVPAVSKVGNLEIPYAQKVTVTSDKEVVFPPSVPAPAFVKSKHRTVFSPVKVVAPSAPPVPVINQAHPQVPAATQIVEQQHHVIQPVAHVIEQQHHVVQPVTHVVEQQHHIVQAGPQIVQQHHIVPQGPQIVQQHHIVQAGPQIVQQHHIVPQGPQIVQQHHIVQAGPQIVQQHHIVPQGPQIVQHHAVQPVAHVIEQQHHVVQPVAHVIEQQHHVVQPVAHVVEQHHHVAQPVPEYTVIHQPVLPKALYQKHIFDVKHGSTPLIYQDLCTVYPYQKNLRACVLKKAALPALHHPDIRTVRVEDQPNQSLLTDNTIIAGGSSIVAPLPPSQSPSSDSAPTVAVTKMLPQNIQDAIRRQKSKAAAQAAAETGASTTGQPETAESRTDASTTEKSRRRRKGSSSRKDDENRGFKLV